MAFVSTKLGTHKALLGLKIKFLGDVISLRDWLVLFLAVITTNISPYCVGKTSFSTTQFKIPAVKWQAVIVGGVSVSFIVTTLEEH